MTFFHRNDDHDYDNKTVSNDDDNDMVAVAVTLLTTTTTRALPLDFFFAILHKTAVQNRKNMYCVWWCVPILKVNNLQCEKQERRSVAIKHNNVFSDRQTKCSFNSTQLMIKMNKNYFAEKG